MIPYPGESLTVLAANDVGGSGSALLDDIRYRAGSATLAAGSQWTAWVAAGWPSYLDDDTTPLDVAWVVEVLSGSVTVTVSEGITATRGGTDTTPIALGVHILTAGTNVIPSTFTVDDIEHAANNLMVRIGAAAGSAVVQQVKLRAWPTGGALGGWSDPYPSWTTFPQRPVAFEASIGVFPNATGPTLEASWEASMSLGVTLWPAAAAGPHPVTTMIGDTQSLTPSWRGELEAFQGSGDGGITYGTATNLMGALLVLRGRDWTTEGIIDPNLDEGIDYIRPPTEVRGEDEAYLAQPIGEGSTNWINATAYVMTGSQTAPVPAPTIDITAADTVTFTGLGELDRGLVVGGALATPAAGGSGATTVAMPTEGRFIVTSLAHTAATSPPAFAGMGALPVGSSVGVLFGTGTPGVDFAETKTYATLPPFRVWTSTAVVVEAPKYLRIMQRGDDLGMGSARVYDNGSRQNSTRVFGSP